MIVGVKDLDVGKLNIRDYDFEKDEKVFETKPKKFISIARVKYVGETGPTDLQITLDGICFTDGILAKQFGDKTSHSIGITLGKISADHLQKTLEQFLDTWRGIRDLRNKGISSIGSIVYCKVQHDPESGLGCTLNGQPMGTQDIADLVNSRIVITVSLNMYVNWRDNQVGITLLVEDIATNF